jgi:TatD DNase family protein
VLIDTHCHLDQCADPAGELAAAAAAGVGQVLAVSESPESMAAALDLQRRWPDLVTAGLGLHPVWVTHNGEEATAAALAWLDGHLDQAGLLGEAGLDHKWATTPAQQERQLAILDAQLELAARHRRPVALHSRRCARLTMERAIAFHQRHGLPAQLHWFTQSARLVLQCNQAGIYVSAGPTVIADPAAQAVARTIADDLLLLETDAPVPIGGRPGGPADTRAVAAALAGVRGSSLEQLAALTSANARRFLGRA